MILESFGFFLYTVRKHGWSKQCAKDHGYSIQFGGESDSAYLFLPLRIDNKFFRFHDGKQILLRAKYATRDAKIQVVNELFQQLRKLPAFHITVQYAWTVLKSTDSELMEKYDEYLDLRNQKLDQPVDSLFASKVEHVGIFDCAIGVLQALTGKRYSSSDVLLSSPIALLCLYVIACSLRGLIRR